MDMPAAAHRYGASLVLVALFAAPLAEAAIGRTQGFAFVSADGEARYSIPLELPAGTNGMTPVLSIEYGHRAGGGLLGVGWSIGGLSQITRCARTFAQDQVAEPPYRGPADRFCLDGQRLVVVNTVLYETPNAEYRTEIESFARIRAHAGTASHGPGFFTVEAADGRIYEYGATSDSRIDGSQGASSLAARAWALNRVRDRAGNVIDYRYTEDVAGNAFRIASIRYNANPGQGVAASHEVEFAYSQRPGHEVDAGFVAGMAVRQMMRLDRIDVRHDGGLLRRFTLSYEPALSSGGRSRLASVTTCGAGGSDCLAPTTFAWQDGIDGMSAVKAFGAQVPQPSALPSGQAWNLIDIDGDGRGDYVWAGGASLAAATIHYRLSRANGTPGPQVNSGIPAARGIGVPFDADADGRADLLVVTPAGNWSIARGSAAGLAPAVDTGIEVPPGTRDVRGADINGDGLGDIVWSESADPVAGNLLVRARLGKPAGGYGAPVTLYSQWAALAYPNPEGGDFLGIPGRRIDLDGDGSEELLMNENYSIARISDTGYGTDSFDSSFWGGVPLELNDDDCTDYAYKHVATGYLRVRLSSCGVGSSAQDVLGPAWSGAAELHATDWNGDGRDDILVRGATNWMVALSRGDAIAPLTDTSVPHEGAAAIAGRDLDGDGLDDIALRTASQVRARFRSGPVPDLLASATDGFGVGAEFAYRPLTDASIHERGSSAAWPDQDLQTNDLVVSTLAATDGSGSGQNRLTGHRYEGLRRNTQGRGSLGFRKVTASDLSGADPLSVETVHLQDFPLARLPESVIMRRPSGGILSSTDYQWSTLDFGNVLNVRRHPYPATITTRRFEAGGTLDGNEITRTVRAVAAIDAESGLVTDQSTTITEISGGSNPGSMASLRTRHTGVLNDVANWCLGRSLAVELTASHTLAGGEALMRRADQTWNGPNCRQVRTRVFPGDGQWQVAWNLTYDAFGNVASEKVTGAGMPARTASTSWGARGQLPERITNPLGQATSIAWDLGRGLPVSLTDPNGLAVQWTYDDFGEPIRESLPDGTATRWKRESCATACDTRARYRLRQDDVDAAGVVRVSAWLEVDQHDRGFRLESRQPGGGKAVTYRQYDSHGRIARFYLPHWDGDTPPGYRSLAYDILGRPTQDFLVDAAGTSVRGKTIRFDGLVVTQTDVPGRTSAAARTAWGNVAEVTDAIGGRTRYEHDAFGALLRVRDALDRTVTAVSYNARGMKQAVDDTDHGSWTWTRNSLGETTALRDAKGQVASFEYDSLGRLTRRSNADGVANWTWGTNASKKNIGRLSAISAPGYSESLTYDTAGRPATHKTVTDATYRYDFSYNALGLLDKMTYPAAGSSGRLRIRHDYDSGRNVRIADDSTAEAFWILNTLDASGQTLDESLGAGIRVVSGFSPLTADLEYRRSVNGGGQVIQDLEYAWDAAGNLTSRRDALQGLTEDFRYDALDRLLQSRRNGAVNLELDYDPIGNILRKSDVCAGASACYAYDETRRHAVVSAGSRSFTYDANGSMTRRDGAAISWSADNLPVSIVGTAGTRSDFSYSPDGRRWRQVAVQGGTSDTTTSIGGLFEKHSSGNRSTWRHYVATPGMTAIHLRHSDGTPAVTRLLALDHLGSTDRVLDSAGNLVVGTGFGAFGNRRRPDWTGVPTASDLAKLAAVTRNGFTGHEQLDHLKLVHMNGRVYDPDLGRFISADPFVTRPFDGQALNRYSYTLNNPLAYVDPSGFDPVPCLATQSGNCVQITVVGVSWPSYLRASGGAHASEIASAIERDPCGQNGSAFACAMRGVTMAAPASVVLTVGRQPDPALQSRGRLDAVQGFAARLANLAISSSPIALLFGADPEFQYFREPQSEVGQLGAGAGNVGYLLGGAAGVVRKGGAELVGASPSALARSFQGRGRYLGIDRFKDITLKKGTLLYAGYPGQGAFYTTASAMRRAGQSANRLFAGLQVAAHETKGTRVRAAAYEVMEDSPAAFGLAIANLRHGDGWLPQVVVPSYQTSLRYLNDFPLGP